MKTVSHNFSQQEEGATDETSDRWTTTSAAILVSPSGRPIAVPPQRHENRSNPIAIVRSDYDPYSESSDDELGDDETSSTLHLELDALSIASQQSRSIYSTSLPNNHLLRAPRLTALSNDESTNKPVMQYPAMLPPAMASADNPLGGGLSGVVFGTEDRTSYGSLRDSNSRGRFLDGPSSYRDKNTGDIRALEYRIRYRDEQNMAQSLPVPLSIGERIMQSQLKRKESSPLPENSQPVSTLSALMEASSDKVSSPMQQVEDTTQQQKNRTKTFYDEDCKRTLPADMLSTSLTGLEILQAGRNAGAPVLADHAPACENLYILPTYDVRNSAFLSRSLSDPTPERPSPNHSYLPVNDETVSPLHLATYQNPRSVTTSYLLDSQHLGALQPLHDANPDAEFGFDFDME